MDRREFEKELQAYRGNDPLEVWQRYIQRVEKCCPVDTKESTLAELLDSCIRTFNNKPQYKTDQRYVSVWIKYASFCKEPVEIFSYMQKNGIGVQFAMFYEAWADATWQSGRSQNANLILQEGISCQAQPLDRLKKKQEIFQKKSQAASTAGGQSKPMVNDENADPNKISRVNGYSHNRNTNHISTQKINDENLKPSAPPQVHGDQDENAYSNLQPNQRIMYCKEKLMNGREELSFEELRAKRWLEKRKKEQEIRAIILNEQKHGMEEERRLFLEEMEKNRAMLAKEAEQIRQDREKMRQEHENMRLMYQQQLQQMNSEIDRSQQQQQQQEIITATQKQQQQMQERVNLQQQQQQMQERVSLQQQQQMQERVSLQQQQQMQERESSATSANNNNNAERANRQQKQQQMQERANLQQQQQQQQMQERTNLQQQQQQQQMQERANLQQQQQQQMQERENLQQQKQMQEMNKMRQQQHQEAMEVEVQQALASQLSISDKQLSGLRTRFPNLQQSDTTLARKKAEWLSATQQQQQMRKERIFNYVTINNAGKTSSSKKKKMCGEEHLMGAKTDKS
ncbi:involucrin-like [Argopecten irradians]|uniref:involucrin-like n=1 Tax=Argopecten irradians TaxID=31199 RepID=UPI00371DCEBA